MTQRAFFTTRGPSVALSIEAGCVSALALSRAGGTLVVSAHAVEPLPAGAVVPALAAGNIRNGAAVVEAARRALHRLGGRARRVALALPDVVAKVAIVRFEKVPPRHDDLDQLIRFHVRKSAPFALEEAQMSFAPGLALPGGGREFVVVLARRDVVQEYEAVAAGAGAHPGLVELATLNVINMVMASRDRPAGDWLLIHVAREYASIAILRGRDLIFFRNRGEAEGDLADLAHQTAMYYEDRLDGVGFERVVLASGTTEVPAAAPGRARSAEQLRRALESRLGLDVTFLEPGRFVRFSDRIAMDPETFAGFAPLIGLLGRPAGAD
jgi:Tfp pilus assembly PilM family ATPase